MQAGYFMDTKLYIGDCLEVMQTMQSNSIDSVITDPPYGIKFIGNGWDRGVPGVRFWAEILRISKPGALLIAFGGTRTFHRLICAIEDAGWILRDCVGWIYGSGWPKGKHIKNEIKNEKLAKLWDGWHTALKPAWEPITIAMKPIDGTFANNAINHGIGGFWIDGSRIGFVDDEEIDGRFPANIIHDGSEEIDDLFPVTGSGGAIPGSKKNLYGIDISGYTASYKRDEGSAKRFFYCAKASPKERSAGITNGENTHSTIKPISLIRYLCRLTKTPKGGIVFDPFMGSGSIGCGAVMEDRDFVGIEINRKDVFISAQRIEHWGGSLLTNVEIIQ